MLVLQRPYNVFHITNWCSRKISTKHFKNTHKQEMDVISEPPISKEMNTI
jgi:hypothetical protein